MVDRALRLVEGLRVRSTRTWEVSVLTLKMLGRMLIGEASLEEPERAR